MKTLNNHLANSGLHAIPSSELLEINGGSWLGDAAEFVGFAVGYTAHAVIDAFIILNGGDPQDHK